MRLSQLAAVLVAAALIGIASKAQTAPAPKAAASELNFDVIATEALGAMSSRADELRVSGVAVVALLPGESTTSWKSEMAVVGRYKEDPKSAGDKGSNLIAVAYSKAAEMADTHKDSGTSGRPAMTGETGWNGGVIAHTRSGYVVAAFSGGNSEDDVKVSQAGLERLKAAL